MQQMDSELTILEGRYNELNQEFEKASEWIEKADPNVAKKHEAKYRELLSRVSEAYNLLEQKKQEPVQPELFQLR